MVDTGVNQSSWNTITRGVSTSTTGIGKLSDMGFSHTDLTPLPLLMTFWSTLTSLLLL